MPPSRALSTALVLLATAGAADVRADWSFRATLRTAADLSPLARSAARASSRLGSAADAADPILTLPGQLQLSAGPRHFPETMSRSLDATAQFQQPIPLRSLGGSRRRALVASRAEVDARTLEARLVSAERAAHAWLDVHRAERVIAARTKAVEEAKALTKLARARVASGLGSGHETALSLAEEALAESEYLDAEGLATEARVALAALLGVEPSLARLDDRDAPTEVTLPSEEVLLRTARAKVPSLARVRAAAEGRAREADFVEAQHAASLGVGFLLNREGTGEWVTAALVTLPLAWSTPGKPETLRARAEADDAEGLIAAEEREVLREVRLAIHEHEHTRAAADAARRAVTALGEGFRLARSLVDRGAADFSVASLARQRLVLGEERAVRAAVDVLHANVRLLALLGALLDEGSP